ncbi:MAG: OmpW/AlkL family protein [Alphaproteobacteria bacterium]
MRKLYQILFLISSLITASASAEDFGSAGKFIIKGKLQGVFPSLKSTNSSTNSQFYPAISNNASYNINSVTSTGNVLGITVSAAYFLTDNIAAESSSGFFSHKVKASGRGPQIVANTVGGITTYSVSNGQSFHQATKAGFIPFSATLQYHIAPYGKISPYIGAGYHYSFATASSGSTVDGSHGPIFQAGFDTWINDTTIFNFEVKKILMNPRITFKNNFSLDASGNPASPIVPISTKLKLDPMTVSAGIGIRL